MLGATSTKSVSIACLSSYLHVIPIKSIIKFIFLFLTEIPEFFPTFFSRTGEAWSSSLLSGFREIITLWLHHGFGKQIKKFQANLWPFRSRIPHSFYKIL